MNARKASYNWKRGNQKEVLGEIDSPFIHLQGEAGLHMVENKDQESEHDINSRQVISTIYPGEDLRRCIALISQKQRKGKQAHSL